LKENGTVFVDISDHGGRNLDASRRDKEGRFFNSLTPQQLEKLFLNEGFQRVDQHIHHKPHTQLTWTAFAFQLKKS